MGCVLRLGPQKPSQRGEAGWIVKGIGGGHALKCSVGALVNSFVRSGLKQRSLPGYVVSEGSLNLDDFHSVVDG